MTGSSSFPPSISTSSTTSSLLLTAAAGVLALSYYGLWTLSYDRKNDDDDEDIITESNVLEIMQRLQSGLQQHYEQHVQPIVQQVSSTDVVVSESQLQLAVQREMERKLSELQCQLLHEYEMDRECLEDAIRDIQVESLAVRSAVQEFEKSWRRFCLLSGTDNNAQG